MTQVFVHTRESASRERNIEREGRERGRVEGAPVREKLKKAREFHRTLLVAFNAQRTKRDEKFRIVAVIY